MSRSVGKRIVSLWSCTLSGLVSPGESVEVDLRIVVLSLLGLWEKYLRGADGHKSQIIRRGRVSKTFLALPQRVIGQSVFLLAIFHSVMH
jgi:hypothetical protein